MTVRSTLACAALALLAGCAAGSAGSSGAGTQSVISAEEIRESTLTNAYDVVQKLRPQYLRVRGRSSINQSADRVTVFVDNLSLGGPETLRTIPASSIIRIEYVRGPDTATRFGQDLGAGVIHVVTVAKAGGG